MKQEEINLKIEKIQKTVDFKVNSYKIIDRGADSLIIEINEKWIFRFPRKNISGKKMKQRLKFLISFSKISPLKLPIPKYIEKDFIGYKKIPGKPLYPTNIERLAKRDRVKIAKQLGLFLKTLHNYKNNKVNFDTGYLTMKKDDYKICPKIFTKYLTAKECKALGDKLRVIAKNPRNFEKPATVIHGDLHFNNILWNPNKKNVTGIIDWAEAGLGIPAMDFIMLADFNKNTNDKFLKDILGYYGVKNDDLFFQIKENAIIDTMNWFWSYHKEKDSKGMNRIIKKLKKILNNTY